MRSFFSNRLHTLQGEGAKKDIQLRPALVTFCTFSRLARLMYIPLFQVIFHLPKEPLDSVLKDSEDSVK